MHRLEGEPAVSRSCVAVEVLNALMSAPEPKRKPIGCGVKER